MTATTARTHGSRVPALVGEARDVGANRGQADANRQILDWKQKERWDPFIGWSDDWFSAVGFPWHPHRGFQTVTLVLDGLLEHRDNAGGFGILGDGDVQYMAAGRYALHYELAYERQPVHTLQLWLNLPPGKKLIDTWYRDLRAEDATLLREDGAEVRIHAGEVRGHRGASPDDFEVPFTLVDARLDAGARFVHELPGHHAAALYLVEGELTAGGETLTANSWAWFDAGETGPTELPLDAVAASRFVVVSAAPIGAPIVTHGPFVMNTEAEIVEAIEDFNAGKFGPVPTDAVTDPRARAR